MSTIIVLIIIFIPIGFGLRGIIQALRGQEKCGCPGDCSHCWIQCQSNENYYGVKKEKAS